MFKAEFLNEKKSEWFPMHKMIPCQICVTEVGRIIMRTASEDKFEVMDLSKPGPNSCWSGRSGVLVKPLPPGTKIILEVVL